MNGGGTVKEQTYSSNLYNRLVNVGYGKDGHDAATMDQLTKVSAGDRISVASETDQTTGAATYKISVNNDGAVASGDANLVAGGTVYSEVRLHLMGPMSRRQARRVITFWPLMDR